MGQSSSNAGVDGVSAQAEQTPVHSSPAGGPISSPKQTHTPLNPPQKHCNCTQGQESLHLLPCLLLVFSLFLFRSVRDVTLCQLESFLTNFVKYIFFRRKMASYT